MGLGVEVDSFVQLEDDCTIKIEDLHSQYVHLRIGGSDTGLTLSLSEGALRKLAEKTAEALQPVEPT
ncbi:hypothetical protein FHS29_002387 [Saccharothrix tamanrassetensis]|uniref:Uncharacterized protein n=1 Tax=Saccharothrix tamanrassetensis TaxID=1051531 RepID=A0A841CJI1_9PSEU|nr:hypothetical protein [Saccharothrix tamanrassetensis]MBB5955806.1 hypothetical protein [Saccharothrix tamanrassetensis]